MKCGQTVFFVHAYIKIPQKIDTEKRFRISFQKISFLQKLKRRIFTSLWFMYGISLKVVYLLKIITENDAAMHRPWSTRRLEISPFSHSFSDVMVLSEQLAEGGGLHAHPLITSIYPLHSRNGAPSTLSPAKLARYSYLYSPIHCEKR
jgi:hypothetical protein